MGMGFRLRPLDAVLDALIVDSPEHVVEILALLSRRESPRDESLGGEDVKNAKGLLVGDDGDGEADGVEVLDPFLGVEKPGFEMLKEGIVGDLIVKDVLVGEFLPPTLPKAKRPLQPEPRCSARDSARVEDDQRERRVRSCGGAKRSSWGRMRGLSGMATSSYMSSEGSKNAETTGVQGSSGIESRSRSEEKTSGKEACE